VGAVFRSVHVESARFATGTRLALFQVVNSPTDLTRRQEPRARRTHVLSTRGSEHGAEARRAWPQLITLAGIALAVACLYWARILFIPIALAILITFLISPVVALVRRTGLGQVPAVIVVVSLTVLLAGGFGWALFSQLTTLANDLPRYRATISRKIADVERMGKGGAIAKVEDTAKDLMAQIAHRDAPHPKPLPVVVSPPHPVWQIPRVIEPLGGAFFVLVLLVFMLIQQRDLRARVIRLFGQERLAETTRFLDEAGERISRYLLSQSALNAIFGVTTALGLFLLDMPFALVWGFFAALLRFIPYVGAWVAALVPITMSLAFFDGWMKPLLIAGLFAVTELTIAFVLEPLVSARSAGVSSIALLMAAAFWTWLWGPIGLALAIPLTVCLVVFSRTVEGLEFIQILVTDELGIDPHLIYYQRVLAGDEQDASDLVGEAAKSGSCEDAYDAILVPALARARHDREIGQLTPAEYNHVIEVTREVLDRVARAAPECAPPAVPPPSRPAVVVAGYPAHDEADRVVIEMLGRLLEPTGHTIRVAPAGSLVSEMLGDVQATQPSLICLGSLSGHGRVRHLAKRLRAACPETPILAACWGLRVAGARASLDLAGADDVVTSLAEARIAVPRLASPRDRGIATVGTSGAGWADLEPAVVEDASSQGALPVAER
jgi:predicted PurR-regulated permease PerM